MASSSGMGCISQVFFGGWDGIVEAFFFIVVGEGYEVDLVAA